MTVDIKLDKKDWKILGLLSQNCRMSLTQIGKKAGISREVADYRIKRLDREGVIKAFSADINLKALEYTKHVVYLELKNIHKAKEEEILQYLAQHPFISWLVTSTGKWSVIFDLHAKNTDHLSALLKELKKGLSPYLGEYQIIILEKWKYFHSKYYNIQEIRKKKAKPISLDKIDYQLLELLRNNARFDYVQLTQKIKLTPEAISKRIKKLIQNNIIKQCTIFPNLTKLGFEHYNLQITLENIQEKEEKKIVYYLKQHKKVSFIYKPLSHWDIECGIFVKHSGECRDFIQELRTLFPKYIRIKDIALFYEEITGNWLPKGIFI